MTYKFRFAFQIYLFYIVVLTFLLFSCSRSQKQRPFIQALPKVVLAIAHPLSDSIAQKAKIIPAGILKTFPALKPNRKLLKSNIYNLDKPQIKKIEEIGRTFPHIDTILLSDKKDPEEHAKLAGFSDIAVAKDAYIKDQNPVNFSIHNKLQGLRHDVIHWLMDNEGNIWFGKSSEGLCNFDGKVFYNYTDDK